MSRKRNESGQSGQPSCPHCGGLHYGTRYDDCPYLKLTEKVIASWPVECIHGNPITEESSCKQCMNSSLGGRKEGDPLPTVEELEAILSDEMKGDTHGQ